MNQLQPKARFQAHETIKQELAKVVDSDNFHFALTFALSEFVSQGRPTAEQLDAVQAFIRVLLNLPHKEEPMPSFPVRTLDHSVSAPRKPPK